jgi:predicted Fe-Mo cluster-binding NifX family protein
MVGVYVVVAALLIPCPAVGAEPLLVAVASNDVESTALVSDFAARSEYYLLFSGLDMVQVLRNPFLDKGPGAGPLVVEYLAKKGVGILVAGRFGPPMMDAMDRRGMRYFQYSGVAQEAAERVANSLRPTR